MAPRVSLGLPVRNGARYLASALDSVLAQTFTDFEVIVSDNASTDDTQAICERYRDGDSRVRYERQQRNRGAAWNFNRVFALARGEFFRQTAHDDVLAPTFLERCVAALVADPSATVAYPRTIVIDAGGRPIGEFADVLALTEPTARARLAHFHRRVTTHHAERDKVPGANADCHPVFGLMRRRDLLRRPGGIISDFVGSDVLLLAEQAQRGRFVEVPEHLFFLRTHGESSCEGVFEDVVARAVWFNPDARARLANYLLTWRWTIEFARATQRVPMPPADRVGCHAETLRFAWRHRAKLLREPVSAALRLLRLRPLEPPMLRSEGQATH